MRSYGLILCSIPGTCVVRGFFAALELRRLCKGLLGECDDDHRLAFGIGLGSKRFEKYAHALLADTEEFADTDDNRADVALAIKNEVLDVADDLARSVLYWPA